MMVAAGEATQGRFPTPALLLVAFRTGRQRLRDMLVLGALYAVGFLAVIAVSTLIDDGQFARTYFGAEELTREIAETGSFQAAAWVVMALYIPLSLLFWHAPGLVHWHGIPPAKALFFSLVACLRNFSAFTVYSLVWIGVFLGVSIAVSIGVTLLALLGLSTSVVAIIMVGTALMLAAMFFTSVVFSFRDCFEPPERRLVTPAPTPETAAEPPGPL